MIGTLMTVAIIVAAAYFGAAAIFFLALALYWSIVVPAYWVGDQVAYLVCRCIGRPYTRHDYSRPLGT
jgi:membrane protein DedA with SNARE-associated domain